MLFRFPRLVHLMKADWEESKHPRADNGQFGSGSGGSTGSKKPSKTKRKMERRAEAAGQATLGGKAIQTLLGGGSALDKIGWLQKPKPELKPETHNSEEEPSILDIINRRNEQAAAMRGKVPGMEHPSQRSLREGAPEGGPSPRVPTQHERDYRDSQRQWDNDRRRMGIPVPGDELATLEIPGKPKSEKKPEPKPEGKPTTTPAKIDSAKETLRENLKSGKLKRETAIAAAKSLQEQADEAKSKGDYAAMKDLNFQAAIIVDAAGIKPHELLSSTGGATRRHTPTHAGRAPTHTRSENDPFAGDPLHDPLPRGYRIRSPEETARYMREHPHRPPKSDDYEQEYKRRTGRDFDPTTA